MDGFHIILYPEDRSWVSTPEFIRGLAVLLGTEQVESLWAYREPVALAAELSGGDRAEKILERRNLSVEEAVGLQRTEVDCWTSFQFGDTPAFDTMMAAVRTALPEECSPLEVSFCNGAQVHYRFNDGERLDHSGCHLTLSNYLGHPIKMDDYLKAFLEVAAIKEFRRRLEELSSQPWLALIDLA